MVELNPELINFLADPLELRARQYTSFEELKKSISEKVNELINTDFEKLVQMLYRVDIDERKLKSLLANFPGTNASEIIAELIIERQLSKIATRKKYRRDTNISEDDKW